MDKLGRFGDNYFWGLHARVRRCKVGKLCARSRLNVLSLQNNIADHRTRKRTNSIFALFRSFHPWHRVIDVRWSNLFYLWTFLGYRYGKILAYVLRLKMKISIILLLNFFEIILIEHLPNDSNENIHMIHGINTFFFFFFFLWIRKRNDRIIQLWQLNIQFVKNRRNTILLL